MNVFSESLALAAAFALATANPMCDGGEPPTPPNLKFEANEKWKAVDLSDVAVREGSALDLSKVSAIDFENGRLPRLRVGETGRLEAEGFPGRSIRLHGFSLDGHWILGNWGNQPDDATLEGYVKLARIQGYNLFRFCHIDATSKNNGDMRIKPALLERVDSLLAIMGRNGVYMHMTMFAYAYFMQDIPQQGRMSTDVKLLMYLGDPQIRAQWRYGAEAVLNHVNPYTGLALKDDTAIACIEFFNEQEFGLVRLDRISQETRDKLNAKFQDWLEAKYKTPDRLAEAWGEKEIKSFAMASAPEKGVSGKSGAKTGDFIAFSNALAFECAESCEKTLRDLGYKGLTAQYNLPCWYDDNLVRFECSQVAMRNNYFHHPYGKGSSVRGFWHGDKCDQGSSIAEGAGYWRNSNATRFADRPFFITEWNHPFWNRYQYEAGLLFSAYSSLQGFDALIVHERNEQMLNVVRPPDACNVDSNPVARANEFLSACLFLRRDVKMSPHRVELQSPKGWNEQGEYMAPSFEQDKIGLLCGFSLNFPWTPRPAEIGNPPKADIFISPRGGASIQAADWAIETKEKKDGKVFNLDEFISLMRKKGILLKDNASDPAKGVFQSDTGELTMLTEAKLLKAVTPRAEALAAERCADEKLAALSVRSSSEAALISACSVDGEDLAASRRIVLLYSTEIANMGMELSSDRITLLKHGTLPVLMKTGLLEASLKNKNAGSMDLFALGCNGLRVEKLPLRKNGELLEIRIDTAKLKNGPTTFFELVSEQ